MPEQPFPGQSGGGPDEPLLERLLTGQPLPPDAPQQLHEVAQLFANLTGPAGPGQLIGEAAARSAFARAADPRVRVPSVARAANRWTPPGLHTRLNARLAAALTVVAIGLGGGAAAYAGALPGPIQDFAHHLIGAPAARKAPGDRQGDSGLCRAYERAEAHGGARARAAALRKLDQAAGGVGRIDAYCAAAGRAALAPAGHGVRHPQPEPAKAANPNGNHQATSHGKPNGPGKPKTGQAKAKAHPKPTARRSARPAASR